jgi:hypothetical protein
VHQGNPNQQAPRPMLLDRSRRLRDPSTANPMGLGTEFLMGHVLQPPAKINSMPGFGMLGMNPALRAEMLRRRAIGLPAQLPPGSRVRF